MYATFILHNNNNSGDGVGCRVHTIILHYSIIYATNEHKIEKKKNVGVPLGLATLIFICNSLRWLLLLFICVVRCSDEWRAKRHLLNFVCFSFDFIRIRNFAVERRINARHYFEWLAYQCSFAAYTPDDGNDLSNPNSIWPNSDKVEYFARNKIDLRCSNRLESTWLERRDQRRKPATRIVWKNANFQLNPIVGRCIVSLSSYRARLNFCVCVCLGQFTYLSVWIRQCSRSTRLWTPWMKVIHSRVSGLTATSPPTSNAR